MRLVLSTNRSDRVLKPIVICSLVFSRAQALSLFFLSIFTGFLCNFALLWLAVMATSVLVCESSVKCASLIYTFFIIKIYPWHIMTEYYLITHTGFYRRIYRSFGDLGLLPAEPNDDSYGAGNSRKFPGSHQGWSVRVISLQFDLLRLQVLLQSLTGPKWIE